MKKIIVHSPEGLGLFESNKELNIWTLITNIKPIEKDKKVSVKVRKITDADFISKE